MKRRAAMLALLATAPLAACGKPSSDTAAVDMSGPGLQLAVDAPKGTHYEMLCAVRTYQTAVGQYVNRYGVDRTGPYTDVIPSPNAHCTAKIDEGPGPVQIHLTRVHQPKAETLSMTIATAGDAGKQTLHVW